MWSGSCRAVYLDAILRTSHDWCLAVTERARIIVLCRMRTPNPLDAVGAGTPLVEVGDGTPLVEVGAEVAVQPSFCQLLISG